MVDLFARRHACLDCSDLRRLDYRASLLGLCVECKYLEAQDDRCFKHFRRCQGHAEITGGPECSNESLHHDVGDLGEHGQ